MTTTSSIYKRLDPLFNNIPTLTQCHISTTTTRNGINVRETDLYTENCLPRLAAYFIAMFLPSLLLCKLVEGSWPVAACAGIFLIGLIYFRTTLKVEVRIGVAPNLPHTLVVTSKLFRIRGSPILDTATVNVRSQTVSLVHGLPKTRSPWIPTINGCYWLKITPPENEDGELLGSEKKMGRPKRKKGIAGAFSSNDLAALASDEEDELIQIRKNEERGMPRTTLHRGIKHIYLGSDGLLDQILMRKRSSPFRKEFFSLIATHTLEMPLPQSGNISPEMESDWHRYDWENHLHIQAAPPDWVDLFVRATKFEILHERVLLDSGMREMFLTAREGTPLHPMLALMVSVSGGCVPGQLSPGVGSGVVTPNPRQKTSSAGVTSGCDEPSGFVPTSGNQQGQVFLRGPNMKAVLEAGEIAMSLDLCPRNESMTSQAPSRQTSAMLDVASPQN